MNTEMARSAVTDARLAMMAALLGSDAALAYRLAHDCLVNGMPYGRIVDDVLQPVQEDLGHRWAAGDIGIADEHAATATIEDLLVKLGATAAPPTRPTVVIVSAPGDVHSIGLRAVSGVLMLDGYRTIYLGGSIPAADLGDFLEFHQPFALALGCSIPAALAGAAASAHAAHTAGIPVLGGGRALRNGERATRLGIDAFAPNSSAAIERLRGWEISPPSRLALTPEPIVEQHRLARHGPSLIDAALDAADLVTTDLVTSARTTLAEDLGRVLAVVEAAIMLDDPVIIDEHVSWLRDTTATHGIAITTLDAILRSLAASMGGGLQRVGEFLRCALG